MESIKILTPCPQWGELQYITHLWHTREREKQLLQVAPKRTQSVSVLGVWKKHMITMETITGPRSGTLQTREVTCLSSMMSSGQRQGMHISGHHGHCHQAWTRPQAKGCVGCGCSQPTVRRLCSPSGETSHINLESNNTV